MHRFNTGSKLGDIVAACPETAAVFDMLGIAYSTDGRQTLQEACDAAGFESRTVLAMMRAVSASARLRHDRLDLTRMSLTALVNHIERQHHAWLAEELTRLYRLAQIVEQTHGEHDPRLFSVRKTLQDMAGDLCAHMHHEESVLFPLIRSLDHPEQAASRKPHVLRDAIHVAESSHDNEGEALEKLRELTDGFAVPDWACENYRELMLALATMERDLHMHLHKENNVLYPRALAAERRLDRKARAAGATQGFASA